MTRQLTPRGVQPGTPPTPARTRRTLHPWAWWVWAIGGMAVASFTRNALMLVLLAGAVTWVVVVRRSSAPWARSIRAYAWLALIVIGIRVVFQIVVGGIRYGRVLFTLPRIPLPAWFAGIELGGPVTLEGLVFTITDAGRLAVLLFCVGAANTLANPRRAFRSVPRHLHRIATAVVIALSVAPQLVESAQRVSRARRLRGTTSSRRHAVRSLVVPILEDSIERSMLLAESMESRGFGSTTRVTRYRPDPWRLEETITACCGLAAGLLAWWLQYTDPMLMSPPALPLAWPQLSPIIVAIAVLMAVPGIASPPPSKDDL